EHQVTPSSGGAVLPHNFLEWCTNRQLLGLYRRKRATNCTSKSSRSRPTHRKLSNPCLVDTKESIALIGRLSAHLTRCARRVLVLSLAANMTRRCSSSVASVKSSVGINASRQNHLHCWDNPRRRCRAAPL
ncbi:TPA: hypothetical protein N0F65_011506, partial [Lagenidium giganteum]